VTVGTSVVFLVPLIYTRLFTWVKTVCVTVVMFYLTSDVLLMFVLLLCFGS